jgi:hypothetical protein
MATELPPEEGRQAEIDDAPQEMVVQREPPAEPSKDLGGRVEHYAQIAGIIGALAVLAALPYGASRYAAERFYGAFGVSPEDAGLTYAALLWPAALSVLLVIAALAIGAWLVQWLLRSSSRWTIVTIIAIGVALLWSTVRGEVLTFRTSLLFCLLYGMMWQNMGGRLFEHDRASDADGRPRHRRPALRSAVLFLIIPLFIATALVPSDIARRLVTDVKGGHGGTFDYPIQALVRVDAVQVQASGRDALPSGLDNTCLQLLGMANGTVLLYEYGGDRVWRVPIEAVTLRRPCFVPCPTASKELVARISKDLRSKDASLREGHILETDLQLDGTTFDKRRQAYLFAADLQGKGLEGTGEIGVWVVTEPDKAIGESFVVNTVAARNSVVHGAILQHLGGFDDVVNCVRRALDNSSISPFATLPN